MPRLIPGHMDLDTGLSPGRPVNNYCRASTHVSWDQSTNLLEAKGNNTMIIDKNNEGAWRISDTINQQGWSSFKPQASSVKLDNKE